jgi:hypothetical protein
VAAESTGDSSSGEWVFGSVLAVLRAVWDEARGD